MKTTGLVELNNNSFKCEPSKLLWLASLAALTNSLSFGLVIGFQAAGFNNLKESTGFIFETENETSGHEELVSGSMDWGTNNTSWFASVVCIGALIGALIAGPILTILGPKWSVIVSNVPYLVCWLTIIFGNNVSTIVFGRFLGGLSVGFSSSAVPVYCVEISTPTIRGTLGAAFQGFMNAGVLMAALVGYAYGYRELSAISSLACIVGPAVLIFMPESPEFLFGKHEDKDAKKLVISSLQRLRSKDSDVDAEFRQISLARYSSGPQKLIPSLREIRDAKVWKPLLASLALVFAQQFSGFNAIMFFQIDIFNETGLELSPKLVAIITGLVVTITGVIGSLIADKFGRKTLLFNTGIGILITLLTLALYFQFKPDDEVSKEIYGAKYGIIALLAMEGFLFFFCLALGPIPWMMVPEMAPYHARSFITAIAVGFNKFLIFVITKNFAFICLKIGSNGAFYLFFVSFSISMIFIKFILRETKGLTKDELERLFDRNVDAMS